MTKKNLKITFLCLLMFYFVFCLTLFCLAETKIENPLNSDDPLTIIGHAINVVLGLVGAIALLMFIWGGFQWMTAGGNPEKVSKGRDTLVSASIGILIIFASYTIIHFVFVAVGAR